MALKPLGALIAGTLINGSAPAPSPQHTHAVGGVPPAILTGEPTAPEPPSDGDALAMFERTAKNAGRCEGNCANCPMRAITPT